jgi:hypothetical protein
MPPHPKFHVEPGPRCPKDRQASAISPACRPAVPGRNGYGEQCAAEHEDTKEECKAAARHLARVSIPQGQPRSARAFSAASAKPPRDQACIAVDAGCIQGLIRRVTDGQYQNTEG